MRADRFEDLTAAKVANPSTSVPAAVAKEEIVTQLTETDTMTP
jgi:hypothetical protein